MEKQQVVILDLSAAFNTVNHDLLEVLEKQYEIVGAAREWYTSYLNPRTFKVGIRGTKSQPRQIDYSVPQDQYKEHSICIYTGSSSAA